MISDRYQIEKSIGEGGQGTVFRAYDKVLQRQVAIKRLRCRDYESLFEARAIARCSSPHIVHVYDLLQDDQYCHIVMEIVDSSREVTAEHIAAMPTKDFYDFFQQLLDAVEAIHSNGVLHLDLKPGNILQDAGGRIKVTDFGISMLKTSLHREKGYSHGGQRMGSWYCLAPEQLVEGKVTEATDIFALGVMLHHYLYQCHPFMVAGDASATRENILAGKPLTPDVDIDGNRQALLDLTAAMLHKRPEARPSLELVRQVVCGCARLDVPHALPDKTLELEGLAEPGLLRGHSRGFWFALCAVILLGLALLILFSKAWWREEKTTLVVPALKTGGELGSPDPEVSDTNFLVAAIVEDELEAAVIQDPGRRLVSKKEWGGSRNWKTEAEQVDVDEIVISEVNCDREFCAVSLSIYEREEGAITRLGKQSIPHTNLIVLTQVVDHLLALKLGIQSTNAYMDEISDADLRLYVNFLRKIETRKITTEEVQALLAFSERYPGFVGAYLLLGEAYIVLYNKESDRAWLDRCEELVVTLNRLFPDSPLVLQLGFRSQILANELDAAEASLAKLKGLVGLDTDRLFLDETRLNFKLKDRQKTYERFIAQKARLTHGYFHEKAYMELQLNRLEALESTAQQWLQRFPDSDVAMSYLGNAWINLGKPDLAVPLYRKLVGKNHHYRYYINLATSELLSGEYAASIATMEQVLQNFPASTYDYLALGEAHKAAQTGRSASYFSQALQLYHQAETDYAHETLLLAYLGRFDEAKIALQNAARTQSSDATFYLIAAQVYQLIGEPVPALYNAQKAVQSGYGPHWFKLPWLLPLYRSLDTN